MLAQNARLLTDEQVHTVHEAALTILEEVGLLVLNQEAWEIFKSRGCRVDLETKIVRFPQTVVEQWRQAFPRKVRFYPHSAVVLNGER